MHKLGAVRQAWFLSGRPKPAKIASSKRNHAHSKVKTQNPRSGAPPVSPKASPAIRSPALLRAWSSRRHNSPQQPRMRRHITRLSGGKASCVAWRRGMERCGFRAKPKTQKTAEALGACVEVVRLLKSLAVAGAQKRWPASNLCLFQSRLEGKSKGKP